MRTDNTIKDALTGAYSRAYLHTRLNEELNRALRYDSSFSILLVDLDYFKSINDAFGHLKGDQVLTEFADLLKSEVRNSDLVFRYGGDEFVILMPYTTKQKAVSLAERLLEQIRSYGFGEKKSLRLTMSCGVATFPADGNSAEDLFEAADQHHYQAKRSGRDCVVFEDPQPYDMGRLEEVSRLIERDEEMAVVRSQIETLPASGRSILRVSGEPGLGITRFLQEASKIARLSGFGVLALRGSPAMENRKYSVIIDALVENQLVGIQEVEKIVVSQDWLARVSGLLHHWLDEKGYSGLLITLENTPQIDRATLDILKGCYFASQDFPLGLVFADSGIQAQQLFPFGIQAKNVIHLHPISLPGIQVWLRQSLRSEPPLDFVEWIQEKTKGYPALIQRFLEQLMHIGVVKYSQTGLSLAQNYREDDLINLSYVTQPILQNYGFTSSPTDFIGRHVEIYALKRLIVEERLVTLVGMGGIGKSRLANQVVLENQNWFTNGIVYISMADKQDAFSLIYSLATALGLKLEGKLSEREQLINYLFNKEILFFLDNVDNIHPGIEIISHILENTLAVRFLVTARERLGFRHEVVYELQGLPAPESAVSEDIETYASIQLFEQIARRGKPDFQVLETDWQDIIQICKRLSGNPLGIELAAAWVESLTCSEILSQLEAEKDLASVMPAGIHSNGRNLQSILESLWVRFSKTEQDAIVAMTIFRGGFSRNAAQSILGVSLFFLDALVSKSILRHSGQDRYIMHEFISQQLVSRLQDIQNEGLTYRDKHSVYYLHRVASAREMISQAKEKEIFAEFSLEYENIRTAWNWAIERENYSSIQAAIKGLFIFFEQRGRFKEGKDLFSGLQKQLESLTNESMNLDARNLYACVMAYIGKFDYHLGDYCQSQTLLEIALSNFITLGMRSEISRLFIELANLKRAQGDYHHARELLNESLGYYREIGDQRAEGDILNILGVIASGVGEIDLAEQYYSASLEIFQALSDPGKMSRAMNNLGYSYMEKGDYEASRPLLVKSLELSQDIGADPLSAAILESLGTLSNAMGDCNASIRYYREGLRVCKKLNALPLAMEIILGFAMIFSSQKDIEQAVDLLCLVYHHPSVVHEIRRRAEKLLQELNHVRAAECLNAENMEITSIVIDHAISNLLFPHPSR